MNCINQGPVVQSIISLTRSLRVISLTVLADSIYNILIFLAEKKVSSFCTSKATHIFFSKKFQHICVSLNVNFNESITKDVISFEQLGPEHVFATIWEGPSLSAGEFPRYKTLDLNVCFSHTIEENILLGADHLQELCLKL